MVKAGQLTDFAHGSSGTMPMKSNKVCWTDSGPDWSGFIIDDVFSPDGTIAIWMINDRGLFGEEDENSFLDHVQQLLWAQ